jgi:hypothetical protein
MVCSQVSDARYIECSPCGVILWPGGWVGREWLLTVHIQPVAKPYIGLQNWMDSLEVGSRYCPVASCCEHGNVAFVLFFLCTVNDYNLLVATKAHIILIYISPYLVR